VEQSGPFPRSRSAFTLLELVIVVSIIAILAGAVAPSMTRRLAQARDARRLSDMHKVQEAIEQFRADKGRWPKPDSNPAYSGWDVSHDGDFISELQRSGYIMDKIADPLNNDLNHYRYYVYNQGSYGCAGYSSFYVLGIRAFETKSFKTSNTGFFACSGRNWSDEFDYVTGGGATQN